MSSFILGLHLHHAHHYLISSALTTLVVEHNSMKQNRSKNIQRKSAPSSKGLSRRGFISKGTVSTLGLVLGSEMVFANNFPKGLIPVGLIENDNADPEYCDCCECTPCDCDWGNHEN